MAFLKPKITRKFAAFIIILLIAVLLTFFLLIKVYIPREIRKLILDFSKQNEIALTVDNISYNPIYGLTGDQLRISGLPKKGISNLNINNITVSPSLIRSYLTGKLIINNIAVKGAELKLTKDILEYTSENKKNISGLSAGNEQNVEIHKISIKDLDISYEKKYSLSLNNLVLSLKNKNDKDTRITMEGILNTSSSLTADLQINRITRQGEVNAEIQGLRKGNPLDFITVPYPVSVSIKSNFKYGESKSLDALLKIERNNKDTNHQISTIELETDYYSNSDTAKISKIDLNGRIISLSAAGEIKDISSSPDLMIRGELKSVDLSELKDWITTLRNCNITGSGISGKFSIESSSGSISPVFEGSLSAKNIDFTDSNNNELTGLRGSLNITADIQKRKVNIETGHENFLRADYAAIGKLELRDIKGEFLADYSGGVYGLEFENFKAGLYNGILKGSIAYRNSGDNFEISSNMEGVDLKLKPLKNIFDLPVSGTINRIKTTVRANNEHIESDIFLNSENINYSDNDYIFSVSGIESKAPLKVVIDNYNTNNTIARVEGNELDTAKISYDNIESGPAVLTDIKLSYSNPEQWDLKLKGSGNNLKHKDLNGAVTDYKFDLDLAYSNHPELSVKLKSKHGYYEKIKLDEISFVFNYSDGSLEISDLSFISPDYGSIEKLQGVIKSPKDKSDNYIIMVSEGKATLFNNTVSSNKIDGKINIITGHTTTVKGSLMTDKLNALGTQIYAPHLDFNYKDGLVKVEELAGTLFSGRLDCKGMINLNKDPGNFRLGISYRNATGLLGLNFLDLGKMSLSLNGNIKNKKINKAVGGISFTDFTLHRNGRKSRIEARADILVNGETISFKNGFIDNGSNDSIKVNGEIHDLFSNNRGSGFDIPSVKLSTLSSILSPLLPQDFADGDFTGSVSLTLNTYNLFEKLSNWQGKLKISNAGYSGEVSKTRFEVRGMEGVITLKDKSVFSNKLADIMGKDLVITKDIYKKYIKQFRESTDGKNGDYLRIKQIQYGFLTTNNLDAVFEADKEKINLLYLKSELYGGNIYSTGVLRFAGRESYNISLVLDDLSLKKITDSLPSMQNYISGIVYGLLWFSVGDSYWSINGPFSFWAKDSPEEKRYIGRALLEQLGAKSRFFTKSSRRYDKGVISGYIKDGLITFKNFEISNSFLGYQDLMIHVDSKMNSISVKHLLSVIRELARRAGKGEIQIDIEKKKK